MHYITPPHRSIIAEEREKTACGLLRVLIQIAVATHTLLPHSKTASPCFRHASGSVSAFLHRVNARFTSTHFETGYIYIF